MPKKPYKENPPSLQLTVPRQDAASKIQAQIDKGREIKSLEIKTMPDYDAAKAQGTIWRDYTSLLLKTIFNNEVMAEEFESAYRALYIAPMPHAGALAKSLKERLSSSVNKLESIKKRLDLIHETKQLSAAVLDKPSNRNVFVVHGRDEAARETVARFLERLDIEPIILHEKSDEGNTIMEKLVQQSDEACFAIVLLTPDDIGASNDGQDKPKPRARQNVILELGYFLGKLGRSRVRALLKDDIDIPTDYDGVLYITLDPGGGWRLKLASEIRAAGIEIDMNRL